MITAEQTSRRELAEKALHQIWGFDGFRPYQMETIDKVLTGQDSLTVLPTGGGKSLCYQLPAGMMQGTAVVVSPLISLMADQVNALQLLGVPAAFINSSQSPEEARAAKSAMYNGELKLLYLSPERLLMDHFLSELRQIRISFFAIDEAHCISQWGHDFRPEYTQLGRLRELFPDVGIHAFTATAPPRLQDEIVNRLHLRRPEVFVGSYHRPNLKYQVWSRDGARKQLMAVLSDFEPADSGIIYCLSRKETEKIADFLVSKGYKALPYHAGMSAEQRTRHQASFQQEETPIIVATVAFGMGIDQSNVRFVVHMGLPRSLSHYQQESGRAGRDGLPSRCVLIYSASDMVFWRRIIEEEGVMLEARLGQLRDMIRYATNPTCRHKALVEHFGQPFEADCNHCDACLGEVRGIGEARKVSRMIISAVLKLRQSFGAGHVAQVLTGSGEKKVMGMGHHNLSVYNLLPQYSQQQVLDWVGQLEAQGYLQRTNDKFPVVKVLQEGYWLLRPDKFEKREEDLPVILTETRKKSKSERRKDTAAADDGAPFDRELFSRLRALRKTISEELGVPAFVVFGDKSLRDMARKQPTDAGGFLQVFGVGSAKLERFGHEMLEVIRGYREERGLL